ncbi:DEAD/DEAH box helicase [Isoptericola hypogeus]|uniref:DEAD/DEAH box helicase n=1 Tax=Isoptericola hypogeus TaxID=300179 RepID=A0ABN2JR25_9MICO
MSIDSTLPTDAPETTTEVTAPEVEGPTFADLRLPAALQAAVDDQGFTTPSPIQARAIPELLAGRDITGVAQTGTGKTAAFAIPLLAAVDPDSSVAGGHVQALVLTPTRELALQVAEAVESFATHLPGVRVTSVYGGSPYQPQQRALRDGVHVVVGTPGRVMDHLERGSMSLDGVKFLVLDEADEMLRMGFAEDVETIFGQAPAKRQVALFSATMPPAIRSVAATHLNDPVAIAVSRQSSTTSTVEQTYAVVPFRHKVGSLVRVLATSDADATIVFTRTRKDAEEVGAALVERGTSAATISGDVAQKEREKIVERLRSGALDVLVATDVAARGLDVDRIGLVVNFDIPREAEAYVHRIGRTGRAGRSGRALSFVTPHERGKLKHIERTIRAQLTEVEVPSPRDVSQHRARRLLDAVGARAEAGRLDLYSQMIREHVAAAAQSAEPTEAETDGSAAPAAPADAHLLQLAASLLALAVGDDGPQQRAAQEEHERERAEAKGGRTRETHRAERTERDGDRTGRHPRADDRGGDRGRGIRRPADGTRYRISVGHTHGAQPRGIVGALTHEGGLSGSDIGKIDIFGNFSLVDITRPLDDAAMNRIGRAHVAGKALRISVDKGAPEHRGPRTERPRTERRPARTY